MHTSDGFPIADSERRKEGIIEKENRFHTDVISPPMKQLRYELDVLMIVFPSLLIPSL